MSGENYPVSLFRRRFWACEFNHSTSGPVSLSNRRGPWKPRVFRLVLPCGLVCHYFISTIRVGTVDDVPLLKTLIQEFATFERLSTAITEGQLRRDGFGTQPKFRVLIAEIDGLPAGYALFFELFVVSRLRDFLGRPFRPATVSCKSVGRVLLAHVARTTEESNGFGIMFNVLDWNTAAIEFYRGLGATFFDDWKTASLKGQALHDVARKE